MTVPRLVERYDALLVDLDGVVHLGDQPIAAAGPALGEVRDAGCRVVFVTNNASRTAAQVADSLHAMGVHAETGEVLTSSMAAADELARMLPPGATVLVVGGEGLREPVAAAGLQPTASADDHPAAVVQGWSPDLSWALLAEAAVAVRRGARWVATNRDATLPSPRGPLPGNGAMIGAVALATGEQPVVVGKPEPALFRSATALAGANKPLVVGDRLDTDIAGANRAGLPSLLVLTGVSKALDLLAAPADQRPTYVGTDLSAALGPAVELDGTETADDSLDPLRQAVRDAWSGRLPPQAYAGAVQKLGLD
ncbi:MAG TPA: HAD-IIA family hydrolase [Mycobacteriales bacterium]|nr:HAD-IIA family hydrolase [Mycobacteriales bacterium]